MFENLLGGFSTEQSMMLFVKTLYFMLIGVVVAIVGWIIYKILKYNIAIDLYEKVGDSWKKYKERGSLTKDGGLVKLRLLKRKVFLKPPANKYYYNVKGIFNKMGLAVAEVAPETFLSMNIAQNSPVNLAIIDQDVKSWYITEHRKALEAYRTPTFWQEYGHTLAFGFAMIIILIMMVIIWKNFGEMGEVFSAAAAKISVAMDSGVAVPPPPS